jgi:large subunit ribosomal protein L3
MKAIIGRKMGMTQVFAEDGTMYAVSVVEVLPNVVTQVKTVETDGYNAIQVGYEDKKESRANKPEKGIFAKAGVSPKYHLFELEADEFDVKLGDEIKLDVFKDGDVVDVSGVSKGKGFTGNIKRYHHTIGPKAHGSGYHRGVGSMAASGRIQTTPKGKKMPGHHGNTNTTVLNLQIVKVLPEKNAILIKGAIPGPTLSIVKIRSAVKAQLTKREVKPLLVRAGE